MELIEIESDKEGIELHGAKEGKEWKRELPIQAPHWIILPFIKFGKTEEETPEG